ncbi:MAG: GAF domain-containing protein [Pseudomonadota bacterium]
MSARLSDLEACFEGVIPSAVATLDADGTPNVSYLSQVYRLDDDHVALSNQFFSKTAANVQATGRATVMLVNGRSGEQHMLDLVYVGSLAQGDVYERMSAQLAAISTQHGLAEAMLLRSAEVYRVTGRRDVVAPTPPVAMPSGATPGVRLPQAARLTARIATGASADEMLDTALDGLVRDMRFAAVMALVYDPATDRLSALGSRGYPREGAGAEVALGEGAIGIAGSHRLAIRFNDMSRGRRYAAAVRQEAEAEAERVIPLPGLPDAQSQLAAPMVARGELFGVLFAESEERFAFTPEDEDALSLVGAQLAASLRLAELQSHEPQAAPPPPAGEADAAPFRVRYHLHDDSLFIDDAYLIKGVPGRLLFHFLSVHAETGRRDFTNREIRLDAALRLPGLKDNLETRLILLRRRLDEREAPVRLGRPARGAIRLELAGRPDLEVVRG